jgi:hypothetical protein
MRVHRHFDDAHNILAPIDQGFPAAQNRFQQQLGDANPRIHNADRALDNQVFQAEMDRLIADREARRRRLQDFQQRFGELERLRRPFLDPRQLEQPVLPANDGVPGAWPARLGGLADNPPNARAGADLDGGLAFGGLHANRAIRNREMNDWFEEQLRNVPRQ